MKVCSSSFTAWTISTLVVIWGVSEIRANTITAVSVQNASSGSNPSSGDVSVSTSVGNGGFTGAQPPQVAVCSDTVNGCAWGQVLVSPTPTVSSEVYGAANTGGIYLPESSTGLTYDFTVNGPGSTAEVDIYSVSLSTLVSQNGCASDCQYNANTLGFVDPAVTGDTQYFGFSEACTEVPAFECHSNFSSDTADEVTSTVYTGLGNELNISANVTVPNGSSVEAFAQMYVWVGIDSSTPDAGAYSISFSDNIGNTAPTAPEPSTVSLAIIAAAGAFAFRKRIFRARSVI